jgi:hypothetical protein
VAGRKVQLQALLHHQELYAPAHSELSEKIAETDNTYNLFRGECLVNETLYFELPQEVLAARGRKVARP